MSPVMTLWRRHGRSFTDVPPLWPGWVQRPELASRLPYYELFWARVDIVHDDRSCWSWTGYTDRDGYGILEHRGIKWRAPRAAWTLTHGPIPSGLDILHPCDNPACCRPALDPYEGLRPGTPLDNARDRVERHRDAVVARARLEASGSAATPAGVTSLRM